MDSLAYFYVASRYLISFMGIRFKLNNLIIISEVLPFFLLIAFSADSFLLTFSTPSIWYVIYDVQINADFKHNANKYSPLPPPLCA